MELSVSHFTDARVTNLQRQFATLDRELVEIQKQYENLRREHGKKCADSLKKAIGGLLDVVRYVNKADKSLIYWFEKGGTLKLALRCVGVDKQTKAITERKTKAIVGRVSVVEHRFHRSSEVFFNGLKAVQTLNTTVSQYSISAVGKADQEASSLGNDLENDLRSVQGSLESCRSEVCNVQEEIDAIPTQLSQLRLQQDNARDASNTSEGLAAAGLAVGGLAAIGAFFFPPLAVVALAGAGYGVGNAINSSGYTAQAERLQERQSQLHSSLSTLRSKIDTLEDLVPELDHKRESYMETKSQVAHLQDRCGTLRQDSQSILNELLQARMILSTIKMKTEAIASQLSECGYARTRREIAAKLKEIVEEIQTAGSNNTLKYDYEDVAKIMRKLLQVEGRTSSVLMIMNR